MTRGLFYALLIAIAVMGSFWALVIAAAACCLRLVMQLCVINTAAHRLGGRLFGIEIVAYDIALPLITSWILISQRWRKRPIYW